MSDPTEENFPIIPSETRDLVARMDRNMDLVDRLLGEGGLEASPGSLSAPANFVNPLGMEMIWCPPGTFMMGSPEDEPGRYDNETLHRVTLTKGFWIGKYPVTQKQWQGVMGGNPSEFKGPENPVEQVSWDDAQQFIAKIGNGYRLPTEAEWEYACRAGTTTTWCFGDDEARMGDYAWFDKNSGIKTHPVGQKLPNPWGIHDMHGNVRDWCQDWAGAAYPTGLATDPQGAASGSYRVNRGGGWLSAAAFARSAYRGWSSPVNRVDDLGFRLAR